MAGPTSAVKALNKTPPYALGKSPRSPPATLVSHDTNQRRGVIHQRKRRAGATDEGGRRTKGTRLLVDVTSIEVESDRLRASLAATDATDWLMVGSDGTDGCVDVRLSLKTNDGVYISIE